MENSTFKQDVPQAMVERIYDSMGQELSSYAQQYGVDLKTLMQLAYGSTEDSYLQDIKDLSAENAKTTIILQAVADAEKLSMSDADFQAELEKAISSTTGYTSVNDVPKEDIEAYREALDKRSAMDFLKNKATVIAPVAGEGNTGATAAEEEAAQ
jgi:trigger factor